MSAPNFLIFVTDQQRADHTGYGGNPLLRTPNLDALAARSLRCDRAIVANPICMPNRSSIVTGRLPSLHGVRYNGIALDPGENTFMRVLRGRGYHTAYFGKLHLQNMGDNRAVAEHIFANAPQENAWRPPYAEGWDAYELNARHKKERVAIPPDFYGLDEVELTVLHADVCGGHYYQWLLEQGVEPGEIQGPGNALPHETSMPAQIWRTAVPEELYSTHFVTQRTVDFLERRARTADAPFLAFCSWPDPHHPFTPPGRFYEMYDPRDVPLPATFDDPHEESPKHYRAKLRYRGKQLTQMAPFAPTEQQVREMAAAEYGMISFIDEGIGRVLETLDRCGLADDTVVLFTSDHGDMFGDHGMMLKAGMHYDGCLRVPFLLRVPGRAPSVCRSLVSSLDVAQTVLDLADAPEYLGMQGKSLVPLLDDPDRSLRDHVLVEEDEMFDLARVGGPLRMRTLVSEGARLTVYRGTDEGELFDLERDPEERVNLFDRREGRALRTEMMERLAILQMEYADESPRPTAMA